MNTDNRFFCATSTAEQLTLAVDECIATLLSSALEPRWLLVFCSNYPIDDLEAPISRLQQQFPQAIFTGCRSAGAMNREHEFETQPSLVVWACCAADLHIRAVHLQYQRTHEGASFLSSEPFETELLEPYENTALLALSDPFTFPMDLYLGRINEDFPGLKVVGGHASGADQPGDTRLFLNDRILNHGCVLLAISGTNSDCIVVSQGCRPIGKPMVVTAAERNQVLQLGGRPALGQLMDLFQQLPTQEQRLVRQGLHLGLVVDEYQDEFEYGDFLIRNVIGLSEEQQSVVVGDFVRVGQTVQFHIRDHLSADQDLKDCIRKLKSANAPQLPQAAIVFACNGRGSHLFSDPDHDVSAIAAEIGPIAVAGMFAAGEFGPIGSANHLHGFTASILFLW